jgi:hypothetical protein
MDDREARMIVGIIAAYWPHQTMPDSTVAAWAHQLRAYNFTEAQEAVENLVPVEKWMPTIADIIAMIRAGWANQQAAMLTEGEGLSLDEFMWENPEWRERVEAFTKEAKGRVEEPAGEPPVDRWHQLRVDAAMLDKPGAAKPAKRNDGHEHRAITHDRCYYCGVRVEIA